MTTRVGLGVDVHPVADDSARVLVLGGVRFDGAPGLAGHSAADVVAHAAADALLGAAGLGDLGSLFPDVDCAVVLEAPRLAPHRLAMQEALSAAVGAVVSVKATRPERLGALGRGEGIGCLAVALVDRVAP
ncbi:MAG: ispF [Acidimicrobiales bacterium]|nr:ispF [Acidimicrobiales bacterium]